MSVSGNKLIYGSETPVIETGIELSHEYIATIDVALHSAAAKERTRAEMKLVCSSHRYLAQQTMRMYGLDPDVKYCQTPWASFITSNGPVQLRLEAIPGRFWSNPNLAYDGTWYALAHRLTESQLAERLFLFDQTHLCDGEGSTIVNLSAARQFGELLPAVCDGLAVIAPPIIWKAR